MVIDRCKCLHKYCDIHPLKNWKGIMTIRFACCYNNLDVEIDQLFSQIVMMD